MTDLLNVTKRTIAWSVVGITAVVSLLAAAVLSPTAAMSQTQCPSLQSGDLVQFGDSASVYMLNDNLERLYFPKAEVFKSWFEDYSGVNKVPKTCSSVFPPASSLPTGVVYRPGSALITTPVTNDIFAVGPDNTLRKLDSPQIAEALYGSDWKSQIVDVADVYRSDYVNQGSDITSETPHNGMLITKSGSNKVYHVMNGELSEVTGSLPSHLMDDVETVSNSVFNSLSMSGSTVTAASVTDNPLQAGKVGQGQQGQQGQQGSNTTTTSTAQAQLNLSLSANTPQSDTVPATSDHVDFMKFNVSAGSSNATLKEITFTLYGLGDDSNFEDVWLEADGMPITGTQSVNSNGKVTLRPNYTIGANSAKEMTLVASLDSANTNQQDGFKIMSASDVTVANGSVSGSFPIEGNKMDYSSYSLADVSIEETGSPSEYNVGNEKETIGEFEIDYSSDNENPGYIQYLRLEQSGQASLDDVSNLGIYESGSEVSTTMSIAGDYITFRFQGDANKLMDGETKDYQIKADIDDGELNDSFTFNLDDVRDLYVIEDQLGVGANIDASNLQGQDSQGNSNSQGEMHTYTADLGQFTISRASDNPGNENYSVDSKDVPAVISKIDAGQPVDVDGLKIYLHPDTDLSNGSANDDMDRINNDIDSAELYLNGSQITSESDVEGPTGNSNGVDSDEYFYDFDTSFTLEDDDKLWLQLDLENDATTNSYKFEFGSDDWDSPEYVSNNDNVDSQDLSGSVQGNFVNIVDGSVTINRNDGYSSPETFITGADDIMVFRTLISAGDGSGIELDNLNYDFSNFSSSRADQVSNLRLMIDGQQVGDSEDMDNNGSVTFDSLNYIIPENDDVDVSLMMDTNTGMSTGSSKITLNSSESRIVDDEQNKVSFNNVKSANLDFVDNAQLAVQMDGDSPNTNIHAVDQGMAQTLAEYKFTATDGQIDLDEIFVANTTDTPTGVVTTSDDRVQNLQLVDDNGNVVDTAGMGNVGSGKTKFEMSSADEISVPDNGTASVELRAVLNKIDQASQTGKAFNMSLYGLEGETVGPGSDLTASNVDGDINIGDGPTNSTTLDDAVAQTQIVHRTVPTIKAGSLPKTVLSDGVTEIFEFTVSADSNYDVTWGEITLDISGRCQSGTVADCLGPTTSMKIEEDDDEIKKAVFNTSSGKLNIDIQNEKETVSAGTTKTYEVEADLQGFSGSNDSLSVRVRDLENSFTRGGNTYSGVNSGKETFIWTDNSGPDEQEGVKHWFNGFEVPGLDTDSLSMTVSS